MKPEGSLPCSQEPATGAYPKPAESCPHAVSLRFTSSSHLRLCLQNDSSFRSFPTYLLLLHLIILITVLWKVAIKKFIIMQFSPFLC
jgi:hypothetical protein